MKRIFITIALIIAAMMFMGCKTEAQKELEDLELKEAQLNYILKLYKSKDDILISEKIQTLDSLTNEAYENVSNTY